MEVFYVKVELNNNGELFIDDEKKQVSDLNSELLESIVYNLLNNDCEMVINKDNPLGNFLVKLKEESADDSELFKSITAFKEKRKKFLHDLEDLDLKYESTDK